jgi:histidinol-phosphate aminotransferase
MASDVRPQRGLEAIAPYVPGKPIDDVKREYGLDDVIKLASNENPLGVAPKSLLAMRNAVSTVNLYPDSASRDLRTAIANEFGVTTEHVVVGNGADDLILQVSMAYLDERDEVVVSRSSFPVYDVYARAMRAALVKTPLAEGYRIDLLAMADAISEHTKLVYVCNPNNPTGTIVSASEVRAFMKRVPKHVLVVFDEAYNEMVDSEAYLDALEFVRSGRTNVVVLRTFSKVYGLAGIRLGYGFGHPATIAPLSTIKTAFSVNALAQIAGIAALQDTEFLVRSIAANKAGREFLYREFARLGLKCVESHTNFVLVRIGPNALHVQRQLLERGVIVRPCTAYDLPEFLRISIGTEEQNRRMLASLEDVLAAGDSPDAVHPQRRTAP